MKPKDAWWLVKASARSWSEDYAPSMGAALAYYTTFSVAPVLLIVIAVTGFVFGEAAARGEILEQVRTLVGASGAEAVERLLEAFDRPRQGLVATVSGLFILLVGATTVLAELQSDLNRIWRVPPEQRKERGPVWSVLRTRLLSLGMVLGIAFLLMVSLVVSAAISALGKWWAPAFGDWVSIARAVNLAVSLGLLTAVFALIFRLLPKAHVEWRDVWIGAAVTAALFTLGKFLIGLYLGRSAMASAYGAAGSVVILLLWVYYSAQIFLLGAEFTWVYANAFGSRRPRPAPEAATPVPAPPPKLAHALVSAEHARRRPFAAVGIAAAAGIAAAWLSQLLRRH